MKDVDQGAHSGSVAQRGEDKRGVSPHMPVVGNEQRFERLEQAWVLQGDNLLTCVKLLVENFALSESIQRLEGLTQLPSKPGR